MPERFQRPLITTVAVRGTDPALPGPTRGFIPRWALGCLATALPCLLTLAATTTATLPDPPFPEFAPDNAQSYLNQVAQSVETRLTNQVRITMAQARLLGHLGNQAEARRLALKVLERLPGKPDALLFLAQQHIKAGELELARNHLIQALQTNPRLEGANRQLGLVLDRLGDRPGAQEAYLAALTVNPNDATAHLVLGQLLLDQGKAEQARPYLAKAVELDPNTSNPHYALAQALQRLGESKAAQRSLAEFQRLKKQEQTAADIANTERDDTQGVRSLAAAFHTDIANAFDSQRQSDLAEKHYRQAVHIAPDDLRLREQLTAFLVQERQLEEAQAVCEQLVRQAPENAAYQINLSTLLLQLGKRQAAIPVLEKVIQLDPKHPVALHNLTRLYLGQATRPARALELAQRLLQLDPTPQNYDLLAWAHYANGQIVQAQQACSQAIALDPTNPVYQGRLRRLQTVTP